MGLSMADEICNEFTGKGLQGLRLEGAADVSLSVP